MPRHGWGEWKKNHRTKKPKTFSGVKMFSTLSGASLVFTCSDKIPTLSTSPRNASGFPSIKLNESESIKQHETDNVILAFLDNKS